jgi:diguanylate cyclase (GGDEF)-like protein
MSFMLPAESPEPTAAAPAARGELRNSRAAALALLIVALGAVMAAVLATVLAHSFGGFAAPVAAALASSVIGLPLTLWLLKLAQELELSRRQLAALDTRDKLTGVTNRPHFLVMAEREWARARRYGGGAALVLVEVDRFQRLCENRGDAAGDAVLRALAAHTGPTLRGADALGRFGGAQLAVWLANADALGALDAAERIRERTEILEVPWQQQMLRVTVSVGVAALRPAHVSLAALIEDADAAVQAARQTGGNCVRAAPVDPSPARKIGPSVGDNQPL